ncbi:MAG: SSS family solute:Na+ symporter [Verrucomicrobiales bacterium]|jgi:SSS family solute:Na+ symporter
MDEKPIHAYFHAADWAVVIGYLLLCTWVGHMMRGKQASIKDFFLGGRSLPWPAVSGSIIATEISGVTFIGVPGMVYAMQGNFTYLQWAIGSILARIIVGFVFVKVYYERDIFSPYDYMENRLGVGVKRLATLVFSIGSILGQSVRVLVAALALKVVTPLDFEWCILVIGVFAIAWTLMGGMQTVIWTDVMQFVLFAFGGIVALVWMISELPNGWSDFISVAGSVGEASPKGGAEWADWGKFSVFDFSTDPALSFTFWVAIIAVPFLNLSAFGVDQLNAQRMFCCRSAGDAKKAIIWSSVGQLLTLLMLMVGAALYVYYQQFPANALAAKEFEASHDTVFPIWITMTLPIGLSGLIIAAVFAAAISSLDSILAALSQTTLSLFVDPQNVDEEKHRKLLVYSRVLVVVWGLALSAFAIVLNGLREDVNMVSLAFGMVAYTTGPMLGLFCAALFSERRKSSFTGLAIGFALSFILVMLVKTDVYTIFINFGATTPQGIVDNRFFSIFLTMNEQGAIASKLNFAWMYPVTALLTFGFGLLLPKKQSA